MTLDVDIEAPPRYSVTAREILSALKSNRNLRRPSWFNYDETDGESSSGDEEFVDALYHFESDSTVDDEVFEEAVVKNSEIKEGIKGSENFEEITMVSETTTSKNSLSSCGKVSFKNNSRLNGRRSVEFASNVSSRSTFDSSDSEDVWMIHDTIKRSNPIPEQSLLRLICPSMATVMILDDDHHGIFSLTERSICLTETVGTYNMQIIRCGGSRSRVSLTYRTEEGTAKPNRDYQHCQGEITFEDGETKY